MGLEEHRASAPEHLGFAVLTISDTRRAGADPGGDYLAAAIESAGQRVVRRELCRDEPAEIRAAVLAAVGDGAVDLVLTTGGTGISERDVTPETVAPLFDREVPGFGELFRWLSYSEIGSATILSRATAGIVGTTVVIALPGSPKALRLAMEAIVLKEAGHLVGQARR